MTLDRRGWWRAWPALALAVLLVDPAAAHAERPERRGVPGGIVERHAERLGFDAETLAQIQAIVRQSGERQEQLEREIDGARDDMRRLLRQPSPPAEQVLSQADRVGALETEARKNRLGAILQIRSLLSPEQRVELIEILEEERGGGRGRRRGLMRRCGDDLDTLCPQASTGPEVLGCLQANWWSLSERCQRAFDTELDARRTPRN